MSRTKLLWLQYEISFFHLNYILFKLHDIGIVAGGRWLIVPCGLLAIAPTKETSMMMNTS